MAASPRASRTGRYTRAKGSARTALSPLGTALLAYLGEFEVLSTPLLARLAGRSHKAVRRLMRIAFDQRLVSVSAVPRALLADPCGTNSAALAFGSAPNLYVLTHIGQRRLVSLGLLERERPVKQYGPQSLFLAHTLMVKTLRCFMTVASREREDECLLKWREGEAAVIDLDQPGGPTQVRPDAWLVYKVGDAVLVNLAELDRGTERGVRGKWQAKITQYEALFASGRLKAVTGYRNARVLVITTGETRRDNLTAHIHAHASPALADRFWLADKRVLDGSTLRDALWRRPGQPELVPLLPAPRPPGPSGNPPSSAR